jgi:hypothetical protein
MAALLAAACRDSRYIRYVRCKTRRFPCGGQQSVTGRNTFRTGVISRKNRQCSGCNVCNVTARELSVGVNHGYLPGHNPAHARNFDPLENH